MKIKVILRTSIVYKNGKSPLMLRFIHERTSKQLSLGVSIEPCYWDKDAEIVTADCPERAALQSRIDSTLAGYRKRIQRLKSSWASLPPLTGPRESVHRVPHLDLWESGYIFDTFAGKKTAGIQTDAPPSEAHPLPSGSPDTAFYSERRKSPCHIRPFAAHF